MNPGQGLGNSGKTPVVKEILNYKLVREDFVEWISSQVSQDHAKKVISYLDRYLDKPITTPQELFNLVNKVDKGKRHLIIAIRNLLKYLETFDLMSEETANKFRKVLKIPQTGVDNRVPSDEEIVEVYGRIDDKRYRLFYRLKLYSGLRNNEVILLLKNFDRSKVLVEGKVARYPMTWVRHTKKTFFAFFPAKFLDELERVDITEDGVSHYFSERGLPAKYLRDWNFTFLVRHGVDYNIANFIQGRAPVDVAMLHYLDTVRVATEQYAKVVDKFPI